jgi:quercetin dioxygenase-like cupin family protein
MTKIPYEIPTEIRDLTAKSIEDARKAFESFIEAAHKATAQAEVTANALQSSAKDVSAKALSFTEANLKAAPEAHSSEGSPGNPRPSVRICQEAARRDGGACEGAGHRYPEGSDAGQVITRSSRHRRSIVTSPPPEPRMPRTFKNAALPPKPDGTGGILGYPVASTMRQKQTFDKAALRRNETMEIKRSGSQPSGKGPADYFTGAVRIDPLFEALEPAHVRGASVTFEPGARTAWHTHPLGQTLIVTSGVGWAQHWGGPIEEIRPGDVVWFSPGEKHWHGATPTAAMTHIAIQDSLNGKVVDWMEHVNDEQYGR